MTKNIKLVDAPAPIVEIPDSIPTLGKEIYDQRLGKLREKMVERNLDVVAIYADREHAANFSYLTGFGPRFEESLLIVTASGKPKALLAPENIDMVDYVPADFETIFFPSFGLLGQSRAGTASLSSILRDSGIKENMTIGTVGWKYYTEEDGCPADSIELPHFLVKAFEEAVGAKGQVKNATDVFMSPADGLRTILEPEQIIAYEYAACLVSKSMLDLMNSVKVGVSEIELGSNLQSMGLPLSAHPMVSVGDKARFGLTSPTDGTAKLGDFMTTAYGIEGAMCCRAAYIANDAGDLPLPKDVDWLREIAIPYYKMAVAWYETIGIGVEGGLIFDMAETLLPRDKFGWVLNPGHLIATDEWVSTPLMKDSKIKLRSGNYFQFDLIIAPEAPLFGADLEDGIVLADKELRDKIRALSPATMARFERRRKYIKDVLGINLADEVLPMTDLVGYYRPFLLNPDQILAIR